MKLPGRLPTSIGILVILITVIGFIVTFEGITSTRTGASGSTQPVDVQVTNVSDKSFTVTWKTSSESKGALIVSSSGESKKTYFDDRDASGKLNDYRTHSVTVKNLTPEKIYETVILSNGKKYLNNNEPFIVKTPQTLREVSSGLEPVYGTVLNTNNIGADGALIYVALEGSQTLSTLAKPSGTWLLPLNQIRNKDLTSYTPYKERINMNVIVRYDDTETIALTDTLNDSPVPTIVIGKDYDFRKQSAQKNERAIASADTSAVLGEETSSSLVRLISPAENARLTTGIPFVKGTGISGNKVTITLGIKNPFSDTTKVAGDGIFRYTPKKKLAPGKQSVTITTNDIDSKPVAITHTFEVLKSGSQVLGDATPSATLTPSPTDTPTATPSATPTITATPSPTPPVSGNNHPLAVLLYIGMAFIAASLLIFAI